MLLMMRDIKIFFGKLDHKKLLAKRKDNDRCGFQRNGVSLYHKSFSALSVLCCSKISFRWVFINCLYQAVQF